MPSIYATRHLKKLVQRRVEALSDPPDTVVSEGDALEDMLAEDYQRELDRLKGDD